MNNKTDLKNILESIHKKSYPAYKSTAGEYKFEKFILSIDHVQGDPFASPSNLTLKINHNISGFPTSYIHNAVTASAFRDCILRLFAKEIAKFSHQAKGSGKSGIIQITRCGQEILERSACTLDENYIYIRFSVGFPANGRTINSIELSKILLDYIPKCVENTLIYSNIDTKKLESSIQLAQDQAEIRKQMKLNGLVAFVANGSILPRESGVSEMPMKNATPFISPKSLEVTFTLQNKGEIKGMGLKKGITLIAGGGYHGKSTLLKALERGVYNHISGDGREYVITDETALKLRAEDGRRITNVDISLFIKNLPNQKSTENFSTLDASGSTSQAANIIEGIEAGSRLLLIDEDTSATNFMVRDELMQQVIAKDKEPITPFLERSRDLYEKSGISTILVVGSCGSYFYIADTILQMDNYKPIDITEHVKEIIAAHSAPVVTAEGYSLPAKKRTFKYGNSTTSRKNYRGTGLVSEKLKVKTFGTDGFSLGHQDVNLRYVEQIVDSEQVEALANITRITVERFANSEASIEDIINYIQKELAAKEFKCMAKHSYIPGNLAMPRMLEIYACLNRYPFL